MPAIAATLIATLGAEPQVIALATQLLLECTPLRHVMVLHTRPEFAPIDHALPELQATFAAQPKWPMLEPLLIPIDDILAPQELNCFADVLYQELRRWVLARHQVHLLLAGGRKSMAMLGISVAQLVLGPDDHVWYLHSDEALRQSGRSELMPNDQAQLIPIPLPQQSSAPPAFTRVLQAETPSAARSALAQEHQRQLRRFVEEELTPAEREVTALVVQDVLTVKEMAELLGKKPKTVTNQLNTIYSKLESFFGLQPDKGVKREFLRRELGDILNRDWSNTVRKGYELSEEKGVWKPND